MQLAMLSICGPHPITVRELIILFLVCQCEQLMELCEHLFKFTDRYKFGAGIHSKNTPQCYTLDMNTYHIHTWQSHLELHESICSVFILTNQISFNENHGCEFPSNVTCVDTVNSLWTCVRVYAMNLQLFCVALEKSHIKKKQEGKHIQWSSLSNQMMISA